MVVSNKHPIIAREGWLFVVISFLVLISSILFLHLAFTAIFTLTLLVLLFIYRDPARKIPPSPLGIVSPIDGQIMSITSIENEFCGEFSLLISLRTAAFGVYSVRSPIEGKMLKQWCSDENGTPKYSNWVQTDEGDNVVWTALLSGKTHTYCYVQPGERIGQGQRCGFLPFGAQVELLVPGNSTLNLKVGSAVRAGESIIAHIVHQQGTSLISDPTLIVENAS